MYKDALRTLKRNFGLPQVFSAHFNKISSFPTLIVNNADKTINFSASITSLVGVLKKLSLDNDMKSAPLPNQVAQKLPKIMKESWSIFTLNKPWFQPNFLDFEDWLEERSEAHNHLQQT